MNVGKYLTEEVIWSRVTSRDFYGDETTEETPILVRWEGRRTMVRNAGGSEVVSEAKVFTKASVKTGDTLTRNEEGWTAINVSEQTDIKGRFSHYELAL